ncbi:alcohol dehydrogenase catalytic domain-containing protein [Frankia sp. R43]|uniref:alcohol dehydrogenase catalytic domain-containing protein n=1 Tax=Frankia sp. R43 TaxID=269536 RepID=UPI001F3CCA5E|nr:alcohol dehydrogenase catalytic domain-containing protein [Frankia sp. R43]
MPEASMPAYRLTDWLQQPAIVDITVPRPGPGEVLVRVAGNGLCHSDLTMHQISAEIGAALGWRVPFTLGHEIAGWIADAGDEAAAVTAAPGTPVALVSPASCGRCRYCLRGLDSACPDGLAGRGYGRDGGLAPYVIAPAGRGVVPLTTLDPVEAAPLTDAGATSYHAVRRALPRLGPGSWAVVLGAGGLGAFAIQHLKALSAARVVAVDRAAGRRALARELGADEAIDGITSATAHDLADVCGAQAADVVLDFVGTDASIATGLRALAPAGAFGLVGAAGGTLRRGWYGTLPREAEIFTFQGSTIADLQDVIALAEAGRIRPLVDRFALADIDEAYAALAAGALHGRAVVIPPL